MVLRRFFCGVKAACTQGLGLLLNLCQGSCNIWLFWAVSLLIPNASPKRKERKKGERCRVKGACWTAHPHVLSCLLSCAQKEEGLLQHCCQWQFSPWGLLSSPVLADAQRVHYDAVVSVYLAALFVQEGRASAQQTVCFLAVAGLMKWHCLLLYQMQDL